MSKCSPSNIFWYFPKIGCEGAVYFKQSFGDYGDIPHWSLRSTIPALLELRWTHFEKQRQLKLSGLTHHECNFSSDQEKCLRTNFLSMF